MSNNLNKVNRNPALFQWDGCLDGNTNEEQYEEFKTAIMTGGTIPVLIDGKVMIYRIALSEETKGLLEKLIEIKEIPEHTTLQNVVMRKDGPEIIAYQEGKLSAKDFRNIVTESILKDGNYIKKGQTVEDAFDYWLNEHVFVAAYYPARKEKVSSKLSQTLYHGCKYADLDYLAGIIYEYLYDKEANFYEEGPHNYPDFQREIDAIKFNETEKQVSDKKTTVSEILKSLYVELCEVIDVDNETDWKLDKMFNPKNDDETIIDPETLRNFIKKYAKHNADILFNSELFDVFTNIQLPDEVSKNNGRMLVHTAE